MSAPVPICPKRRLRAAVCAAFDVSVEAMLGGGREPPVINARYAFALLVRERWPLLSYAQIGRLLGGRDHSTVMHGVAKFNQRLRQANALFEVLSGLRSDHVWPDHNAHVITWCAVRAKEVRKFKRAAAATERETLQYTAHDCDVAEAVRVISIDRRVKPKNALSPDDGDAVRRKHASDGLSAAIAAAGGWR